MGSEAACQVWLPRAQALVLLDPEQLLAGQAALEEAPLVA